MNITSRRRAPLLTIYSALVFAFIYLPIVVLILYSFNRDGVGGFPPHHFTLNWYRHADETPAAGQPQLPGHRALGA